MPQPGSDGRDEGADHLGAEPSSGFAGGITGEAGGSAAAGGLSTGASAGPWGYDAEPPGGFPREGYKREAIDPLPPGYGWAPPSASLPPGWTVDPRTREILPPGGRPSGQPPEGLLPGYSWIGPDSRLPEGWHVDPETDVLTPPEDLGQARAGDRSFGPEAHGGPVAPGLGAAEPTPWPQGSEAAATDPSDPRGDQTFPS